MGVESTSMAPHRMGDKNMAQRKVLWSEGEVAAAAPERANVQPQPELLTPEQ